MPPRKSFQPQPGKKKLSFGGQPLHTNDVEHKSVPESESVACSASTSDNNSILKKKEIPSAVVEDLWLAEI